MNVAVLGAQEASLDRFQHSEQHGHVLEKGHLNLWCVAAIRTAPKMALTAIYAQPHRQVGVLRDMGQEVVTISEVGPLISMLALVSEEGEVRPLEVVLRLQNVGSGTHG